MRKTTYIDCPNCNQSVLENNKDWCFVCGYNQNNTN